MELFDELYGAYYACVEQMIKKAPLDQAAFRKILEETLSFDGGMDVSERLSDGRLPMLAGRNKRLESALENAPERPLTRLERAYLRALADDPRAGLFLAPERLKAMKGALGEGERLFLPGDFDSYDRFLDGDSFESEAYRDTVRAVLSALRQNLCLAFDYTGAKGRTYRAICRPFALEYSGKDDKFRMHSVDEKGRYSLHNVSRMQSARAVEGPEALAGAQIPSDRCPEPLSIEVTDERDGISRFMLEFSYLEKQSVYDADRRVAHVRLWYPMSDETEILVRLLGFGPVLRVLGPDAFVKRIRERVSNQREWSNGSGA